MASAAIKALEILVLLFLPGACVVAAALARKKISCLEGRSEFLFLSVAISFAASSVVGLILAYLGLFSLPGLCLILAVMSLLPFFLARAAPPGAFILLRRGKSAALPLLLVLILAGILFFRPVEYIFGGWDPGVYVNTAVHLARTGSLTVADPWAAVRTPDDRLAISHQHKYGFLERYPGFRYGPPGSRILIPQFYHLWTVWLACAYGLLGLHGMFYLTPFLGLLSLLAIYLFGRELWDKSSALLAVLLLSLNIAEIWQARFPTSEILAQFLVFSGVFSFARYLRLQEKFWAWTSGLILGVFLLSQISSALILVPLAVFFYCRWFLSFRNSDLAFSWPFSLLLLLSLGHHLFLGKTYAASILPPWIRDNPSLLSFPIVAMIALAGARLLPLALRQRLAQSAKGKPARIAAAVALAVLLWFAYFVRPYLDPANQDAANLVEFGWLVSPWGLALASLALLRETYRDRRSAAGFFLLLVICFAGNFLWRQLVHQHYLWAARRFSVIAVPGAVLLASRLLTDFPRGRAAIWRIVSPVAVVLLVFSTARMSQVIWRHDEYRGALDFCDRLSGRMGEGAVVVVWSDAFTDKLPTPLDLAYRHQVVPLYRFDPDSPPWPLTPTGIESRSTLSDYYLLTDRQPPAAPGIRFDLEGEYPYHSGLLERRIDRLPQVIDQDAPDGNFTVRLYRVSPDRPAK
jgi:hypothetical protein